MNTLGCCRCRVMWSALLGFRARLGHLMYNAIHLTGEDIERAWESLRGVSWGQLKLCVGEERFEVT